MQVRRTSDGACWLIAAAISLSGAVYIALTPHSEEGLAKINRTRPSPREMPSPAPLLTSARRTEAAEPVVFSGTFEVRQPPASIIVAGPSGAASPLLILPIDEAQKYVATRANLVAWVESVDELSDVDPAQIEWTEDLEYCWGLCKEHQALRMFILSHQGRERQRWTNREQSVSLESELTQVRGFMDLQLGYDEDVWQLVNAYSSEVATVIRSAGETADSGDDEGSRWDLQRALSRAGAPAFEATVTLLRGQH